MSIRTFVCATAVVLAAASIAIPVHAADPVKIRFVLNWKYQGPQAWFFVAQDKGYFKAEGSMLNRVPACGWSARSKQTN